MNTLTPENLRTHLQNTPDEHFAIVDVRSPAEFRSEHVEGSINIPLDTVLSHTETLRSYSQVYLYCQSGNRSEQACARLTDAQIPHSISIQGGITEMGKAGFTIVRTKGTLPLQRQVLLGAGSIVTAGLLFSFTVSPWFQLISLGAGFGLMYAGISGNCMLANVLSKMPWNKS